MDFVFAVNVIVGWTHHPCLAVYIESLFLFQKRRALMRVTSLFPSMMMIDNRLCLFVSLCVSIYYSSSICGLVSYSS